LTGANEQFEDAALTSDPLEKVEARDDSEAALSDLATGLASGSLRFRVAVLGGLQSSGSRINAMDPRMHLPTLEIKLVPP
jgi:hypothetical protein